MTMFGGASSRGVMLVHSNPVDPPARPLLVSGREGLWPKWCLPSLLQLRGYLTVLPLVEIGSCEAIALPDGLPFVFCFSVTGGGLCSVPLLPMCLCGLCSRGPTGLLPPPLPLWLRLPVSAGPGLRREKERGRLRLPRVGPYL